MNKDHYNLKKKNKVLHLFLKGMFSIKNDGIKVTIKRIIAYKRNQTQKKYIYNKTVDYFHEIKYQNTTAIFLMSQEQK